MWVLTVRGTLILEHNHAEVISISNTANQMKTCLKQTPDWYQIHSLIKQKKKNGIPAQVSSTLMKRVWGSRKWQEAVSVLVYWYQFFPLRKLSEPQPVLQTVTCTVHRTRYGGALQSLLCCQHMVPTAALVTGRCTHNQPLRDSIHYTVFLPYNSPNMVSWRQVGY